VKKTILILSCEHASYYLPSSFHQHATQYPHQDPEHAFEACDPFSGMLTESISKTLNCDYLLGDISRYLIDLNKNQGLSEWAKKHLSNSEQHELLRTHYDQYRQKFITLIEKHLQENRQVLHLSIHTFNPKEKGVEHNAAVGILYDPSRHGEKEVARIWSELLLKRTPYRVRLNYPRSGKSDNFTSHLRKQYEEKDYLGLELECNAQLLKQTHTDNDFSEQLIHSIFSLMELL
jgi:hypothetical protein